MGICNYGKCQWSKLGRWKQKLYVNFKLWEENRIEKKLLGEATCKWLKLYNLLSSTNYVFY